MNNTELLLAAFNSSNPDELYETLNLIGEEDIDDLIGLAFLARAVIKKITGMRSRDEGYDGWLARRRI